MYTAVVVFHILVITVHRMTTLSNYDMMMLLHVYITKYAITTVHVEFYVFQKPITQSFPHLKLQWNYHRTTEKVTEVLFGPLFLFGRTRLKT